MLASSLLRIACLALTTASLANPALAADPGSAVPTQFFSARPANLMVSPLVFRQFSNDTAAKTVPLTTRPAAWAELEDQESRFARGTKTLAAVALLTSTVAVGINRKSTCYVNASPGDCVR